MIIVGNPSENNTRLINRIHKILKVESHSITLSPLYFSKELNAEMKVLDVGKSLRENFSLVSKLVSELHTLDLNVYENYPDIQMDLCENTIIPGPLKYDVIFCFSLLEHCYNPIVASENLFKMLKPNSRIIGSVPFLFPYHCPNDLSYQDYFRFTKDSFVSLFPKATKIIVYPHRGRVGAALNIVSQRYKYLLEKKFPVTTNAINRIDLKRKSEQSSGFHFEIFN